MALSASDTEDLTEFLRDNLTLDVSFQQYEYGGGNQLTVKLKLNGEEISSTTCTVEPVKHSGGY